MIFTVLDNIVQAMNSNGKSYVLDVGWAEWLNKSLDEFDATKGLVLFDSDSPFVLTTTQSGRILEVHKPSLFFAFKADLDWTPLQHDTNCVTPAIIAAKEMITRLEQDNTNVDSVSVASDGVALFNQKDVNISGILIQLQVELRVNPTICV